jgi:cell wall-associated NlpC family hydrolase
MSRRALTVAWFHRYIGLPFGDGPGEVNCWTLVCQIYANELGVDLPRYGEISSRDLMRIARAMDQGKDDGWRVVSPPRAFDVALMRGPEGGTRIVHVGVMIDGTRMLHVEEECDAVVVPVSHWTVANRITGYRRRAA